MTTTAAGTEDRPTTALITAICAIPNPKSTALKGPATRAGDRDETPGPSRNRPTEIAITVWMYWAAIRRPGSVSVAGSAASQSRNPCSPGSKGRCAPTPVRMARDDPIATGGDHNHVRVTDRQVAQRPGPPHRCCPDGDRDRPVPGTAGVRVRWTKHPSR
jgi:hypothetical protein